MIEHTRLSQRTARSLARRFCQPEDDYLWGDRRRITPVLLPYRFGDGCQLIAVRPIITRQSYFVIVGDSGWELNNWHESSSHFRAILKRLIYDLMEDHFGICECEECGDPEYDTPAADVFEQWPIPCFDGGCEWWPIATIGRRS